MANNDNLHACIHLHLVLSYTGQHRLKAIARLSNKNFSNKWPSVMILKWVCCAGWPDCWSNMSSLYWVTWLLGHHEFAVLGDLTVGGTWVCCAGWQDLTVGQHGFAVLGDLIWLLGQHEFAVLGDPAGGATWVSLLCWVTWSDCWGNTSLLCWVTRLVGQHGWVCCAGWPDLTVGQRGFAVLGDLTVWVTFGETWICMSGDLTVSVTSGDTWVHWVTWPPVFLGGNMGWPC